MIKFDRDVHFTLKALEKEGFETYAIGDCVRDSIRGFSPYDWDLVTKADIESLKRLFPKGKVISEDAIRLDFTYEVAGSDDEEPSTLEGVVCDVNCFTGSIEDEVAKYGFTCSAIADNPERALIDPYNGKEDISKKLVKTVEDPDEYFKEQPIKMMEAVRLAAEMNFDLQKGLYEAILANWRLLLDYSVDEIRNELERIVTADFAGKGLNMLAGTGLMTVVLGEELAGKVSSSEMQCFNTVCENIDKTKPVRLRRLGLLYTCFSKKKGLAAIERLNFDEKSKMHLDDAMKEIMTIQFLGNPKDFKRYLFEKGLERYDYVHNLTKAQRIVFDQPKTKIESRNHMMKEIISMKEPVFVEDLVIDANDLMEAGIAETPESAEEILSLVVAEVHENPKNNDRKYLLKKAKKYSKSNFARKTRYIKWLK